MKIPDNLFNNPDIFPQKLGLKTRTIECCSMRAESYHDSPFLDHRIVKANDTPILLNIDKVNSLAKKHPIQETNYIFHNAFCCSTLFSRCVNTHQSALVLREPNILLEQASVKRFSGTQLLPAVDQHFFDATALLSQNYYLEDINSKEKW